MKYQPSISIVTNDLSKQKIDTILKIKDFLLKSSDIDQDFFIFSDANSEIVDNSIAILNLYYLPFYQGKVVFFSSEDLLIHSEKSSFYPYLYLDTTEFSSDLDRLHNYPILTTKDNEIILLTKTSPLSLKEKINEI